MEFCESVTRSSGRAVGTVPFQAYSQHFARSVTFDFDPSPVLRNPEGSLQYQKLKGFSDKCKNGSSKSVPTLGGLVDKPRRWT